MKEKIECIIYQKLQCEEHYLREKCAYKYYVDFFESVKELDKNNFFQAKKRVKEFCNKMQFGKKFNKSKYMQGISEYILWYYFSKKLVDFEIDVQQHSGKNNNTDVDIQTKYNDYVFNFEVKCPSRDYSKDREKTNLNIDMGFRTIPIDKLKEEKIKIEKDIISKVLENSNGEYSNFEYKKINDTKLLSYIVSCREKFIINEDNKMNILFLSLESEEMQEYWNYIYNPYSGIFTDKFEKKFFCEEEKRYYTKEDIAKVDLIVLSNIITGHVKPRDCFNSWNLDTYFSLLCMNPYSYKFEKNKNDIGYELLYKLIPNDNLRFEEELTKVQEWEKEHNISVEPIFVDSFIADYYKIL